LKGSDKDLYRQLEKPLLVLVQVLVQVQVKLRRLQLLQVLE
jgi:hypothetical protein